MNKKLTVMRSAARGLSLALALVLAGCATSFPSTATDVVQRIEAARTRADHESLATYFIQEAAKAREIAGQHQKMANLYRADTRSALVTGTGMYAHCNNVVKSYQGIATEYESMAVVHRQLADLAKP